jgi:exonuclease III
LLGVYAPNNQVEKVKFWKDIEDHFRTNMGLQKPDMMGGNFNMVEDAIDRLPMHEDTYSQIKALDDLKRRLNLRDGWRDTFSTSKMYTFHQSATGSQSHID